MNPIEVEKQVRELEAIRAQTRFWRIGATVSAFVIVIVCVAIMNNAVQNLVRPGPVQEQFVTEVSTGLQQNVVPELQRVAVQTVNDSQPIVAKEFSKLNKRVPDVAEASMKEFEALQKQLPERTEKVLDATFGEMLHQREDKIRAMFPGVTDEKLKMFLNNLTDEGHLRLSNVNHRLFDPHLQVMNGIAADMMRIEQIEAPNIKTEVPTWQMGLLLFDIARADFKDAELPGLGAKPSVGAPAKKANAQPHKGY